MCAPLKTAPTVEYGFHDAPWRLVLINLRLVNILINIIIQYHSLQCESKSCSSSPDESESEQVLYRLKFQKHLYEFSFLCL